VRFVGAPSVILRRDIPEGQKCVPFLLLSAHSLLHSRLRIFVWIALCRISLGRPFVYVLGLSSLPFFNLWLPPSLGCIPRHIIPVFT
jgi:hypothetical protein